MKFDFDSITPGISSFPSGSLTGLEQRPLVRVARVRRFQRDRMRLRLPDDVDHVGERDVAMVRALVISPAKMQPHFFWRNIRKRVVERLDVQLRFLAPLREAEVRVLDVPSHPEVGQSICSRIRA
jgi:hypothetical protein